jgi:CRISPR-associated endonuclease Cas1
LEQQGGVLRAVLEDGRPAVSLPLDRVREVLLLGTPTIHAEALRAIGRHGISLWATDDAGRVWLHVGGDPPLEDAEAVAQQVAAAADEPWRLALARSLVAAKLGNYGVLAEACLGRNKDYATGRALRKAAAEAREAPSVEVLLGVEGAGAARWYGALDARLPAQFPFTHRVAPHAGDPVNVLLNFAFTVLHRLLIGMIRQVGLCPALGLLHRPHPGHAALASDVQEPFRHLMDLAVIETLHRLQPRDFIATGQDEFPLRLSARASRELLSQVHRLLATPCQAPGQSEPKPYRHQALSMIRALRTHLRDRHQPFVPFEHP